MKLGELLRVANDASMVNVRIMEMNDQMKEGDRIAVSSIPLAQSLFMTDKGEVDKEAIDKYCAMDVLGINIFAERVSIKRGEQEENKAVPTYVFILKANKPEEVQDNGNAIEG